MTTERGSPSPLSNQDTIAKGRGVKTERPLPLLIKGDT